MLCALDRQRLRDWALLGVTLALLFCGSLVGPVVVLSLLVYLAVAVWRGRDGITNGGWRMTLRGAALACFVCALLFAPQLLTILRDLDYASVRIRTVFLFSASAERRVLLYDTSGTLLGSFPVNGLPQGLGATSGGQLAAR